MTARARIAVLALLATAVAGCGAEESDDPPANLRGEQRAVAAVVEDLEEAGAAADGNEICSQILAQSLAQSITRASGSSCAEAVDDALGDVDADDLEVRSVRISGSTATVAVRGKAGDDERDDTLTLRRERAGWRITGLG